MGRLIALLFLPPPEGRPRIEAVEAAPNFCFARLTRFFVGAAFSGAAFLAGAFFATVFFAAAFLAGAFLATAFLVEAFFTAFLAVFVVFLATFFLAATS